MIVDALHDFPKKRAGRFSIDELYQKKYEQGLGKTDYLSNKRWKKNGLKGHQYSAKKSRLQTVIFEKTQQQLEQSFKKSRAISAKPQSDNYHLLNAKFKAMDKVMKGQISQDEYIYQARKQLKWMKPERILGSGKDRIKLRSYAEQKNNQMIQAFQSANGLQAMLLKIDQAKQSRLKRAKRILHENQIYRNSIYQSEFQIDSRMISHQKNSFLQRECGGSNDFIRVEISNDSIKEVHEKILGNNARRVKIVTRKKQFKQKIMNEILRVAKLYRQFKLTSDEIADRVHLPDRVFKRQGSFILFKSIKENRFQIVQQLLTRDRLLVFDIDEQKKTPLIVSSELGRLKMVKLIISCSPNIEHNDLYGKTALCYAVQNNYLEIVKDLLMAGSDPWSHNRKFPLKSRNPDINFVVKNARMVDILVSMTKPRKRNQRWLQLRHKITIGKVLYQP